MIEQESSKSRGVFLLPNLFTTAGLFAGFYAIIAAMKGAFDTAAIAMFIGMVADALDGRVARLTNTQSEFGAEYDSLSDMVTFGLAPALLAYNWGLGQLGKLGWLAAFLYCAATALRLAKFNVTPENKNYFLGLPCPAAAGLVGGCIWFLHDNGFDSHAMVIGTVILLIIAAFLMVSNIRYNSFKAFDFKGHVPIVMLFAVALVYVLIYIDPPKVLFIGFALYALSGIILFPWTVGRKK